jgi:4-hydroxy-3-methylbut-2-enyl diphosphate reductase IspH
MVGRSRFFFAHGEIKADYMTAQRENATKGNGEKCDIFLCVGAVRSTNHPPILADMVYLSTKRANRPYKFHPLGGCLTK